MAKAPVAKSMRPVAERAGEWWMREVMGCVRTRRALRTKFARVDFYAADIIGKLADGACIYSLVTAGQAEAVRTRRRKLEAIPWHPSERVLLLKLFSEPDSAKANAKLWYFRVHEYLHQDDQWVILDEKSPIKPEWFKAWREPDAK